MIRRHRALVTVLILVTGLSVIGLFTWKRIVGSVVVRMLPLPDDSLLEKDTLRVVLCGTGTPVPTEDRLPAATAILAGDELILVDAGPGTIRKAHLRGLPVHRLSTVLVTHFHSDHMGGLGQAIGHSWFFRRREPIHVYGPPGIEEVVAGFVQAYRYDTEYRSSPEGGALDPKVAAPEVTVVPVEDGEASLVFKRGDLRVYAFAVDHSGLGVESAYGYRIEYRDRVVVLSGDTERTDSLIRHARGADVLIHSATGPQFAMTAAADALERRQQVDWANEIRNVRDHFATPVEAAEVAEAAGAETLVLSHVPALSHFLLEWVFLWGVGDVYDGEVILGEDGMTFELEAVSASSTESRASCCSRVG